MVYRPIQIKYSATNVNVPTLLPGELAFTQAGNTLFIGSPDGASGNIRVGGEMHPGVLTANQALVANTIGGIDRIYATNGDIDYILSTLVNSLSVNSVSINSSSIHSNSITSKSVNTHLLYSNSLVTNSASADNITVNTITANGDVGEPGFYLSSSGPDGNVYWSHISTATGVVPYFVTTTMYDYTAFDLGYLNIAPNQNVSTLGFRSDVEIPYGSIWLYATNTGDTDELPITINSPSTIITPMIWISVDQSGPFDPVLNPAGKDIWFNMSPALVNIAPLGV